MSKTVIALICPKHGFTKGNVCLQCSNITPKSTSYVNTESYIEGWYEHIDPKGPIYIHDKAQLKRECESRGLLAKSLMKPKSQDKGFEMR